jgi:hypothetical protein
MKYEYYGYTVELPINLYLDGTDEILKILVIYIFYKSDRPKFSRLYGF